MARHDHVFKTYELLNVIADNPKYSIDKSGVYSFIMVACKCKKGVPIAYGKRSEMQAQLKVLKEG